MHPIEAKRIMSLRLTIVHQVNRQAGLMGDDGKIKSDIANITISFLSMCSEFETVTVDKTGAQHEKFSGFNQGKVHVEMGIKSLAAPFLVVTRGAWGTEQKHEDYDLAIKLTQFVGGHLTVKQMYYGIIRLLASDVQLRFFIEIARMAATAEDTLPTPDEDVQSSGVFGSHHASSLEDIPF